MAEQSPTQLINDWVAAAESAKPSNAQSVAQKIANLYTNNAVLCATPEGIVNGRTAIENDYQNNFSQGWELKGISNQSINQGTAPNWAWAYGKWSGTFPGLGDLTGTWSILLVNQSTSNPPNWLIQQHTIVTDLPSQTR
jgi:ketosteroid isomerase-like protein